MKKTIYKSTGLVVASAFLMAPVISGAQIGVDLEGNTDAQIETIVDTDVEASTQTSVDAGLGDINAGVQVDTDIEAESQNDYPENGDDMNGGSQTEAVLHLNALGVAVVASNQVNTEEDLEIFAKNTSLYKEGVAKLNFESGEEGDSEVKVEYRHKGKLLGLIPVTIKSTTVVEATTDAEAEVRSKMAWWGFLVSGKNYTKSEIESNIRNNAVVKAQAEANIGARTKAEVAEAVIAELTAHANTSVSN